MGVWSNAARQLLVGFLIYLKSTRGQSWGWRELADMVATPQANILPIMSAYHPEAIRAVERASVTTQGILINLASFSASIFDLAEAWGDAPEDRRVSFVEWAQQRGRHRQLILQGHGAYPELTKSYLEGALGTVSAIVNSVEMDDDEHRKLWLFADECGKMGRVPIRDLIDLGRSRGMRCVLACQDLAQLEEIYGAHMVKALVSMVGTILVGQIMQGDTADQLCKALGTKEVERKNVSSSQNGSGVSGRSTTLSFSRDELAIYKPSELASRLGPTPDGKGVKFALCCGGNASERDAGQARKAFALRRYVVFNAQQMDGVPQMEVLAERPFDPVERAEALILALKEKTGLLLVHGGDQACYVPALDEIRLPAKKSFASVYDYYATALHEGAHSTLHKKRMDRHEAIAKRWGDEAYAVEELRAEICSAILAAETGVPMGQAHIDNHAAYLKHWLKVVAADPMAIFSAAKDAELMAEYMLGLEKQMTALDAHEDWIQDYDQAMER